MVVLLLLLLDFLVEGALRLRVVDGGEYCSGDGNSPICSGCCSLVSVVAVAAAATVVMLAVSSR